MPLRRSFEIDFKKALVVEFLKSRKEDPATTAHSFLQTYHPDIDPSTLYTWISRYKELAMAEADLAPNEAENKYGTEANELDLKSKFIILMETAKLSEEDFGAYCRQKGLYAADIKRWHKEIIEYCTQYNTLKKNNDENRKLQKELKKSRRSIETLSKKVNTFEHELNKKNDTLATYAAELTVMRNFSKLFRDKEED